MRKAAPLAVAVVLLAALAQAAEPGRRLLLGDYQKKLIAVIAPDNTVEWEYKIGAIHDAQVLPNGNILFQTSFKNVLEVTPAGEKVWEYKAEGKTEIHAFRRLADGTTMIAESGKSRIIEVDPDGKVVHVVKLKVEHPHPHRDTRLVRKTDAGTYLVAHESDTCVREYDATGKIVWEYPVGSKVYSAIRLDNGNTLIGAGDGHRVIEVSPEKKIVWSLENTDLEGITLAWVTMVDRLPNGNTLVVNCHAGAENPQLLEVTPEKKVVWQFKDFKRFGNSLPVGVLLK